jgi:hypothetical protein
MVPKANRFMKTVWLLGRLASLQLGRVVAGAAEESPLKELPPLAFSSPTNLFMAHQMEIAGASGIIWSPFGNPESRPVCNYTLSYLQVGYMLSDRRDCGILSGNFEFCAEAFGGGIFEGTGDYVAGYTLWGRYNFVHPGWRLVPFLQAGAGMAWTDVGAPLTGQLFNFNLDLGMGFRYFVARQWSVNLEYRFQHISNARLDTWDLGINAQGPIFGVSFFF